MAASATSAAVYDAVVVGLGAVGSFALRGLAQQGGGSGRRFLGIERFALGHGFGSSHGRTRIYRRAYFEHDAYVPWIDFSLNVFRELEAQERQWHDAQGKETTPAPNLMQECGVLLMEPEVPNSSQASAEGYWKAAWETAAKYNIPVEALTSTQIQRRYPHFKQHQPHAYAGLLEPHAGFLRVEPILAAAQRQAREADCVDVVEHAQITSFQPLDSTTSSSGKPLLQLEVQRQLPSGVMETQTVATKCLLVSLGAWTGQLIPSWEPHLEVTRQIQAWIDVTSSSKASSSSSSSSHHPLMPHLNYDYTDMPIWLLSTPEWPLPVYGLPCDVHDPSGQARHWLKCSIHGRNQVVEDPTKNSTQATGAEAEEIHAAISHALEGLAAPPKPTASSSSSIAEPSASLFADLQPCLYTMTADSHFLLGTPAACASSPVFSVAGLSGHGFKQAPALGQMMVDYALSGGNMSHVRQKWGDADFCNPQRFGV